MARSRNIKAGIVLNDVLAGEEHWVRLLFIYLWTIADRAGRLADNPRRIGASLFPYEPELDFELGLTRLAAAGFIQRYSSGGEKFIQVLNWATHQHPHHKEPESSIPSPVQAPALPVQAPVFPGQIANDQTQTASTSHEDLTASSDDQQFQRDSQCPVLAPTFPVLARAFPVQDPAFPVRARLIPDSGSLIPDSGSLSTDSRGERAIGHCEDGFQQFWQRYPKRSKELPTQRAYCQVITTAAEHAALMAGLERWLASGQWVRSQRDSGNQFIVDPDRFILEARYREQPEPHVETSAPGVLRFQSAVDEDWLEELRLRDEADAARIARAVA